MKFSVLKRIFEEWRCNTDITLNMNSDDISDEDVRSHDRYPFGPHRPNWMTAEDENNMKEDFIAMRKLINEIESASTDYVSIAILKDKVLPLGKQI